MSSPTQLHARIIHARRHPIPHIRHRVVDIRLRLYRKIPHMRRHRRSNRPAAWLHVMNLRRVWVVLLLLRRWCAAIRWWLWLVVLLGVAALDLLVEAPQAGERRRSL